MAFFRKWKLYTKHKKLSEDWGLAASHQEANEIGDGDDQKSRTTFNLKYLGSTAIDSEKSKTATAEAVKTIMSTEKKTRRKALRVNLTVSPHGIEIFEPTTENSVLRVSIYKISYCSADSAHEHVFAFIGSPEYATIDEVTAAANVAAGTGTGAGNSKKTVVETIPEKSVSVSKEKENNGTGGNADKLTCYIFLCPKRRIAHDVSLTVAHCFENAYQMWRQSVERKMCTTATATAAAAAAANKGDSKNNGTETESNKKEEPVKDLLIDFTPDIRSDPFEIDHNEFLKNTWVAFDDDQPKDNNAGRFISPSPWEQQLVC